MPPTQAPHRPSPPDVLGLKHFGPRDDVVDLVGVHPYKPLVRRQPNSKSQLIADVITASAQRREVRALGSAWSLSAVAEAQYIIDTLYLWKHLSAPFGAGAPLDAARLAAGATDVLAAFCARSSSTASRHFIHVEAGIKIDQLLADLKACGLALPTMGAGGGQALVGALSTGTHGADFTVPPLIEWVRAVHLVGPLGKEWWITPANSPFTGPEVLRLADWPDSGEILADDQAFDAVRLGVGRMGVIYSLILEVVKPYTLLEVTQRGAKPDGAFSSTVQSIDRSGEVFATGQVFTDPRIDTNSWVTIRERLAESGVANGRPFGLFNTPITDFTAGWIRDQVVEPTASAVVEAFRAQAEADLGPNVLAPNAIADPVALALATEFAAGLSSEDHQSLVAAAFPVFAPGHLRSTFDDFGLSAFIVRHMGLADVAGELDDWSVKPLRHLNIVVSLTLPDVCWVTRRWALPGVTATANMSGPPADAVTESVRATPDDPEPVLKLVSNRIVEQVRNGIQTSETGWLSIFDPIASAGAGIYGLLHVLKPIVEFINREVPGITNAIRAVNGWSGEGLFLFLYRAATNPHSVFDDYVRRPVLMQINAAVGKNVFVNPARVSESCDIFDVHGYDLDYAIAGDSTEYLFDGNGTDYLTFVDEVTRLARTMSPIFGYMGIRFTPRASALLAMQRYELTASVEIATARARIDPVFDTFWARVHQAAHDCHGIPHWGQEFLPSGDDVAAHYGDDLQRWREVLAELSTDDSKVFSTPFTRALGLEPADTTGSMLYDPLSAFLVALDGASDS